MGLKITGDVEFLFGLRLRQVCEKYRTRTVQLEAMRVEVEDLLRAGVDLPTEERRNAIIKEIHDTFGTNIELKPVNN